MVTNEKFPSGEEKEEKEDSLENRVNDISKKAKNFMEKKIKKGARSAISFAAMGALAFNMYAGTVPQNKAETKTGSQGKKMNTVQKVSEYKTPFSNSSIENILKANKSEGFNIDPDSVQQVVRDGENVGGIYSSYEIQDKLFPEIGIDEDGERYVVMPKGEKALPPGNIKIEYVDNNSPPKKTFVHQPGQKIKIGSHEVNAISYYPEDTNAFPILHNDGFLGIYRFDFKNMDARRLDEVLKNPGLTWLNFLKENQNKEDQRSLTPNPNITEPKPEEHREEKTPRKKKWRGEIPKERQPRKVEEEDSEWTEKETKIIYKEGEFILKNNKLEQIVRESNYKAYIIAHRNANPDKKRDLSIQYTTGESLESIAGNYLKTVKNKNGFTTLYGVQLQKLDIDNMKQAYGGDIEQFYADLLFGVGKTWGDFDKDHLTSAIVVHGQMINDESQYKGKDLSFEQSVGLYFEGEKQLGNGWELEGKVQPGISLEDNEPYVNGRLGVNKKQYWVEDGELHFYSLGVGIEGSATQYSESTGGFLHFSWGTEKPEKDEDLMDTGSQNNKIGRKEAESIINQQNN